MSTAVESAADFDTTIKEKPLVVVDFHAEWCGPCKLLSPILEKLSTEWGDRVAVLKLDIEKVQDVAMRYGVMSVPTLMLFRDGEAKDTLVGLRDANALKAWVDQHSN